MHVVSCSAHCQFCHSHQKKGGGGGGGWEGGGGGHLLHILKLRRLPGEIAAWVYGLANAG